MLHEFEKRKAIYDHKSDYENTDKGFENYLLAE